MIFFWYSRPAGNAGFLPFSGILADPRIAQKPKTCNLSRKNLLFRNMVARLAVQYTVLALLKHRGDVPFYASFR